MRNKILMTAGREGNFFFAEAMQKAFGMQVDIVTYMQCANDIYEKSWRGQFNSNFNFVEFYKERIETLKSMNREEIDARQLAIERKYSIETSALFTYYDPHFRREFSYDDLRYRQLAYLEFLDTILDGEEYAFVLSGVSTYFMNCLQEACLSRDIPYITTIDARYLNIAVIDKMGQQIGMETLFNRLMAGDEDAVPKDVRAQADEWYENFVSAPKRPPYAIMNSRGSFSPLSMARKAVAQLSPNVLRQYSRHDFDKEFRYIDSPSQYLVNGVKGRVRALAQNRSNLFNSEPDLSEPFFYLPLHLTPEIVDLVYGTNYDHHEGYVVQLAKRVPSDVQIYVKDHTSMLGRRPASFYKKLKSLYNVQCIHPSVSTFELIRNSRAVVTVTGTAGWEAFLLGKPTVTFGNVFYNFLPGIFKSNLFQEGFTSELKRYLENFETTEQRRRNAVRAYFGSSFPGTMGDIGIDTKRSDARSNARAFAENLRKHLRHWRDEIQGTIPEKV
ncbi:hypothetical protein [Desulfohalovibrio reitneri]|uniref:capsular polysaccharide export protein, LipB/KpsS family n=1 Tax=Desulfohalovibrio reitneri TaxID=1307759 RepID=UPI0004A7669A|nr:hypothetical protein [Desulfohalovibrio reitneri]